jgi:endonuclease-3
MFVRTELTPDWETIFTRLETWRNGQEPSVNTVAARTGRDPWSVLVSTIISLRTKDAVTIERATALLSVAADPASLLVLPEDELARLIYPAGFYRTKAANLRKIASILIEQYQGQVPADMDRLLALPGVGRKTANLVLTEGFDQDGICVDVHVHRISNRTGWMQTTDPAGTEETLRSILPRSYWKRINTLLVLYGQQVCRPVSPFCSRCVIHDQCIRCEITRSR